MLITIDKSKDDTGINYSFPELNKMIKPLIDELFEVKKATYLLSIQDNLLNREVNKLIENDLTAKIGDYINRFTPIPYDDDKDFNKILL